MSSSFQKGRGAQLNTPNPYEHTHYDQLPEEALARRTEYIKVHPKTILNKITSPDIPADWGLNPYQGCEHGCVYCYARTTHPYWGYSAGLDFETKILIKENAPTLLEVALRKPGWQAAPVMMAGNTDIYQPAEQQFGITRRLLDVFWKYRHPVGLITKNSLVLRDIDLLRQLAAERLACVTISLTTLQEEVRRYLEPRTASVEKRLQTIETLTDAGVPVNVLMAPIIPGLTDHEMLAMAKAAADRGARSIGYTVVRLNGDVATIFEHWVRQVYPDRADRILNRIRDCRGGQLGEKRFGVRHRGEGSIAEMINQQFQLARKRFFKDRTIPEYNLDLHASYKDGQLRLF